MANLVQKRMHVEARRMEIELTIDDLRESRILVVDPAPIPHEELLRTYEWMKSWDMLESGCAADELINMNVQKHGYEKSQNEIVAAH